MKNQDKCTISNIAVLSNSQKKIFFKDLTRVWKMYMEYNAPDTILIDDSLYKAYLNTVSISS